MHWVGNPIVAISCTGFSCLVASATSSVCRVQFTWFSVVVVVFFLFYLRQIRLKVLVLPSLLYKLGDTVRFIDVYQAKLLKCDKALFVVVKKCVNVSVVFKRHSNPAKLKTLNEFLEFNLAVKVDIKVSECLPVISKLLLEPVMYNSKQLLSMARLSVWGRSFIVCAGISLIKIDLLEILKALNLIVIIAILYKSCISILILTIMSMTILK